MPATLSHMSDIFLMWWQESGFEAGVVVLLQFLRSPQLRDNSVAMSPGPHAAARPGLLRTAPAQQPEGPSPTAAAATARLRLPGGHTCPWCSCLPPLCGRPAPLQLPRPPCTLSVLCSVPLNVRVLRHSTPRLPGKPTPTPAAGRAASRNLPSRV